MTDTLSDDEREWAENLRDDLTDAKEGIEKVLPKIRAVLDGEITPDEYNTWMENHEETLRQIDF